MRSWLTNELRPYFGLEPLEPEWELRELREGYWIAMEGDLILKRITSYPNAYSEDDVRIETRDCAWIMPRTARGKEKKLNYTGVSSIKADGVQFSAGIRDIGTEGASPSIRCINLRNSVSLPLTGYEHLRTIEEMISWLKHFPSLVPSDYDKKLHKLTTLKSRRYTPIPGDIFRVEIDLWTDGYVRLIGDLSRMRKDGLFSENSIWNSVMTVPLFVRPYLYQTRNRSPELEEIVQAPLADSCWIVMDDLFMRGVYEHVGHLPLKEEEIVLPIGYGIGINNQTNHTYRLSWGMGTVSKPEEETDFKTNRLFLNHGVNAGVNPAWFSPEETRVKRSDVAPLDYKAFCEERRRAFAEFGLPEDISYDEFNRRTGGLTRAEYLEYLNKTY